MICCNCNTNLVLCCCADVTERLQRLIPSKFVYVGNIIEARIAAGLNKAEDFSGDIHYPLERMEKS